MLVQKLKNVSFQTLSVLLSIFAKIISDALSDHSHWDIFLKENQDKSLYAEKLKMASTN